MELQRRQRVIYLDNAATSFPKAPGVAQAVYDFLENVGANAGRSSHQAARTSSRIVYQARAAVAQLLGIENSEQLAFCFNATHGLNTAIRGLVKPGMEVVTSCMEHNSVMRPLRNLEATMGVKIHQFGLLNDGLPDMAAYDALLQNKPQVVVCTAASNVTGVVFPIHEIAAKAKEAGAITIIDASQLVGSYPFTVDASTMDCVCFPGHKGLLGPTGTGGIYVNPELSLAPLMTGGTGSRSDEERQPQYMPDLLESGTPNIAGIAGLLVSAQYLLQRGIADVRAHKECIITQLIQGLDGIPGIDIQSPRDVAQQVGVISITASRLDCATLTRELDKRDIAVRMGLHCAPGAHRALGTFEAGGTVRLSPGVFTTKKDIDTTLAILGEILL